MSVIAAGSPSSKAVVQAAIDKARTTDFTEIVSAAWQQDLDLKRVLDIQSPCRTDNSDMKGIQRIIKNLQGDIERIKRFSNLSSTFDALTNENEEPWKSIKKVINYATTDISGYVKNIMGRVRGWVLNTIQNQAKQILPFLFPGEMPSFINALGKGTNLLSCAFAKIIRGLAKTVGNLLLQTLDRFISGPMCLAENFVNNLLEKIIKPIQTAIGGALGLINGFLSTAVSAVQNLASSLFNAIDFVTGILNFFKCDDDKACPTIDETSLAGPGTRGGDAPGSEKSDTSEADEEGEGSSTPVINTGTSLADSNGAQDNRVSDGKRDSLQAALDEQAQDYGPGTTQRQRQEKADQARRALDLF